MTFQEANDKFQQFKKSGAPVIDGVSLVSRGKVFELDFDLNLVDGKVAITAKTVKTEQPEQSQTKKRK